MRCSSAISCKDIADEHRIGVASVERYYHQMMQHKSSHWANRAWIFGSGRMEGNLHPAAAIFYTPCDNGRSREQELRRYG